MTGFRVAHTLCTRPLLPRGLRVYSCALTYKKIFRRALSRGPSGAASLMPASLLRLYRAIACKVKENERRGASRSEPRKVSPRLRSPPCIPGCIARQCDSADELFRNLVVIVSFLSLVYFIAYCAAIRSLLKFMREIAGTYY